MAGEASCALPGRMCVLPFGWHSCTMPMPTGSVAAILVVLCCCVWREGRSLPVDSIFLLNLCTVADSSLQLICDFNFIIKDMQIKGEGVLRMCPHRCCGLSWKTQVWTAAQSTDSPHLTHSNTFASSSEIFTFLTLSLPIGENWQINF